jgi:segregation and condensation protein B
VAGGFCFRTRPEMAAWVARLGKQQVARLSPAALETLAIVAYKQPVLRAEIERLRGVDAGGVLRMLMEKDLVRVVGRKDLPGRPLIYGTTRRFLETFGLNDLKDLPSMEEIEAVMGEALAAEQEAQGRLNLEGDSGEAGDQEGGEEWDQDEDAGSEEAMEAGPSGEPEAFEPIDEEEEYLSEGPGV